LAFKNIVKIWNNSKIDKKNVEFLTIATKLVKLPLTKYDKKIIKDLKDTASRISCAGIAANQIGHSKKIFIGFEDNSLKSFKIYINPEIIRTFENFIVGAYQDKVNHIHKKNPNDHIYEGCLSLPDAEFSFPRYHKIEVKYLDEAGNEVIEILEKFHAQIFQHETDHLNGKTIAHRYLESLQNQKGGTLIPIGLEEIENIDEINKNIDNLDDQFDLLSKLISK
tara:strand:+ start:931 stop:1599 length:669 start_codon:yes stop_codon:yes gene_type:complete